MPLNDPRPINETTIYGFNPVGGTPAGTRTSSISPIRGRLMITGVSPLNGSVQSAMTLAVAIDSHLSSVASAFVNVITSTLGTFHSTTFYEGACCSVVPASPVFVNQGDAIQWTTSGGHTSAIGTLFYAVIRQA